MSKTRTLNQSKKGKYFYEQTWNVESLSNEDQHELRQLSHIVWRL